MNKTKIDDRENYQLEVNVYDYSSNSDVVENIGDSIEIALQDYSYIDDGMQFRTFLNVRNTVQEQDKKIKRKRLLFDLLYFERR